MKLNWFKTENRVGAYAMIRQPDVTSNIGIYELRIQEAGTSWNYRLDWHVRDGPQCVIAGWLVNRDLEACKREALDSVREWLCAMTKRIDEIEL